MKTDIEGFLATIGMIILVGAMLYFFGLAIITWWNCEGTVVKNFFDFPVCVEPMKVKS